MQRFALKDSFYSLCMHLYTLKLFLKQRNKITHSVIHTCMYDVGRPFACVTLEDPSYIHACMTSLRCAALHTIFISNMYVMYVVPLVKAKWHAKNQKILTVFKIRENGLNFRVFQYFRKSLRFRTLFGFGRRMWHMLCP